MSTLTHLLQHISGKGHDRITNLCFADDIAGLAGEEELANLVEHLDKGKETLGFTSSETIKAY